MGCFLDDLRVFGINASQEADLVCGICGAHGGYCTRLPKCVMFGELVGATSCVGDQEK